MCMAKKAMAKVKKRAHDELYTKVNINEGENGLYRLAQAE